MITAIIIIVVLLAAIAPPMVLLTMRKDRPPSKPKHGWRRWDDED